MQETIAEKNSKGYIVWAKNMQFVSFSPIKSGCIMSIFPLDSWCQNYMTKWVNLCLYVVQFRSYQNMWWVHWRRCPVAAIASSKWMLHTGGGWGETPTWLWSALGVQQYTIKRYINKYKKCIILGLGDKTITICIAIDTWSISIKNVFDKTFDIFYSSSKKKQRLRSKFGCINKGTRSLVT